MLSAGRPGNIQTTNHRREVGPDQAVAVGPTQVVVLIWLEIDADAYAVDHARHAGASATNATATALRSYPEPHLAAAGALACATRATPAQIAGLTLDAVTRVGASLASGHRIARPFQPLLDAQMECPDFDGDRICRVGVILSGNCSCR
jgi:microcystin-dependent protein